MIPSKDHIDDKELIVEQEIEQIKLSQFIADFADELTCKSHLKEEREKQGIVCKKCGGDNHYWLKAKWQWQCSACRFRTTLRSGTFMESAKLPIRTWYIGMACTMFCKKIILVTELQRHLRHRRYESIWTMMVKIRSAGTSNEALFGLEELLHHEVGTFEILIDKKGR